MSVQIRKHYASFSEAIREGAKLHPQGYGMFFEDGKTCAFGAGRAAIDGPLLHYSEVYRLYPYLNITVDGDGDIAPRQCPVCVLKSDKLASVMFHLNDDHRWTREVIADWLESEEEKLGFVTLIEEAKESAQELVTV